MKTVTENVTLFCNPIPERNLLYCNMFNVYPRCDVPSVPLIKKNQKVVFFYKKCEIKKILKINITAPLPKISKRIKNFSVDDGKYFFRVKKITKNFVYGKSRGNFEL